MNIEESLSRPASMEFQDLRERCKQLEKLGYYAGVHYQDLGRLHGKLLTLVDAVISDPKQCEAAKSLTRNILWHDWVESLERSDPDMPVGIPISIGSSISNIED